MKEFKKGDKCYIELEVIEYNNDEEEYPIICVNENGEEDWFTETGKHYMGDKVSILKHIEDLQPKNEFPKEMEVSDDGINWDVRKVVYMHETGHCIALFKHDGLGCNWWSFCREIQPEYKEETINKSKVQELITEIWDKLNTITKEINK